MADHTREPMIVKYCAGCPSHEYQDKKYGKGMRLHNPWKVSTSEVGYRCTVCGRPVNAKSPWNFNAGRLVLGTNYAAGMAVMKVGK